MEKAIFVSLRNEKRFERISHGVMTFQPDLIRGHDFFKSNFTRRYMTFWARFDTGSCLFGKE